MTRPALPSLATLAVKSAAWYGATRLWGQLLSWGVTILLARLLVPADYGLFAVALSVLAVLELLQEFGLGTAIVQRQTVTRQQINAVFWVVAATSLLLTAATFVAAGAIANLYADPRLAWTLRVLCLTFLLNSLGVVPYSLLTKAVDLRHRSLADAFGGTASALIALSLAYLDYGVWALVLGHLARALILNSALFLFARWVPGLDAAFHEMGAIFGFGLRIAGSHLAGSSAGALSTFILARVLGGTAVGLYSMAQSLTEAPHRLSTAIISQVSLPVFSKLQHDRQLLAAYFMKISKYLAAVSFPLQVGLFLVAPDLVPVVLSPKWDAIVVPFQIFCLESVVILSTLTCSPLLAARGRAKLLFNRSFLGFVWLAGSALVGAPFGLVGVAAARLITIIPVRLTLLGPTLRELGLSFPTYAKGIGSPLAATAIMAGVVLVTRQVWSLPAGHLESLVGSVVAGAAGYGTALFLLDRSFGSEIRTVARGLFSASGA